MNVLALDLGTRLGYALRVGDRTLSGMRNVGLRTSEGPGRRWTRFRDLLGELAEHGDIGAIYFEELVHVGGNQMATLAMFGGFRAHLEHWAEIRRIPLHGVNLSTIKKHWTGSGRSDKAAMQREAKRRGLGARDNNEIDALALLDYALCAEGEATPTPIEVVAARPVDTSPDPFAVHA